MKEGKFIEFEAVCDGEKIIIPSAFAAKMKGKIRIIAMPGDVDTVAEIKPEKRGDMPLERDDIYER